MNTVPRFLLMSCFWSLAIFAAPVTITEKQLELGKDPKTQKILMIKAYSFTEGTAKETSDTRWLAVFPYESELVFFATKGGLDDCFPVTNIISTQPSFKVDIDPTEQNPIIDPQQTKADGQKSSMVSMHVTISQDLQLFKDLLIFIAKGNVKALTSLVNKHTLKRVEETVEKALDSQGACFIQCDDPYAFESIMQAKNPITAPVVLTGQLKFVPMQEILEQALAEVKQQEQSAATAKV